MPTDQVEVQRRLAPPPNPAYHPPVGSRSSNDSAVRIFQAFLRQRTWPQAALAREVGIGPAQMKRLLESLERDGVLPLDREVDHPHVYWSLPKGWFPGGVYYQGSEVESLLRLLARSPKSKERDRLISIAGQCFLGRRDMAALLTEVVRAQEPTASEAEHQELVERSAVEQKALHVRYYSTRGKEGWRHISVQRVTPGPPARFIGLCHRTGALRWFRVGNVLAGALDDREPYRGAGAVEVEEMLRSSLDGFYETGPTEEHAFFVRDPDARWVAKNLLEGMRAAEEEGGVRVRIRTAALPIVARFVVGLGGAAIAETPALRSSVVALAEGALAASSDPIAPTKAAPTAKKKRAKSPRIQGSTAIR